MATPPHVHGAGACEHTRREVTPTAAQAHLKSHRVGRGDYPREDPRQFE
eukprot:CAMPEP_0204129766 /NCGR_PEP_ID=MMETSP0361-20130328/12962_1 /ASSEMBLY_ACC=CAM_ASM_000343 /TAXON_ID=268821 /ORGANISM="Scrippsiella Hangoei, Strain SHTV-5" /LENGTH=48 /DNA_ID= /DNA_START= /DNA_END= /DNA_ORIENTATION=